MARLTWGRGVLFLASLGLLAFPFAEVHAADENSGTFGATFLRIPVGARVMAVPDIVAGMNPDASLTFSNPAVVGDVTSGQLFLTTANWLDDLSFSAASIVVPFQSGLRWSVGTRFLYSGGLQGFNASNQVVEEESYYDVAATTGLSKRFNGIGLALGADVTYVREHFPGQTGDGVTFSFGGSYQLQQHRVDFFARDLGGTLSFPDRGYPIDSRYTFGYGYMLNRAWGQLNLGGQMTMSRSQYQRFQIGATYMMNNYVSLRSGFDHAFSAETSLGVPLSMGIGVHYRNLNLDYAFTEQQYFSDTHTVSVTFAFGHKSGAFSDELGAASQSPSTQSMASTDPTAAAALPASWRLMAMNENKSTRRD